MRGLLGFGRDMRSLSDLLVLTCDTGVKLKEMNKFDLYLIKKFLP